MGVFGKHRAGCACILRLVHPCGDLAGAASTAIQPHEEDVKMPTTPDKVLAVLAGVLILHGLWGIHAYVLWRIRLRRSVPSPMPPILALVALFIPWRSSASPIWGAEPWSAMFIIESLVLGLTFTAANVAVGYALPAIMVEPLQKSDSD
jgi:hypothetical protein